MCLLSMCVLSIYLPISISIYLSLYPLVHLPKSNNSFINPETKVKADILKVKTWKGKGKD